jgi:hypothetical protein
MSAPSTPINQMTTPFNAPPRIRAPVEYDGYDSNISSPGVCDADQLSPFMGILSDSPVRVVRPRNAPNAPRKAPKAKAFSKLRPNADIRLRRN